MTPYIAELVKLAEEGGFWRTLPESHTGHGRGGEEIKGRTWVTKNRMRNGMKPMAHQVAFAAAAKDEMRHGRGVIAAHGTGTGKTFSAINTFEEMKQEGTARRALVVVPAGLRSNFLVDGVQKFTTSKGVILRKPQKVADDVEYVVVSYAAFRRDPEAWITLVNPDTLIADEVQRAGNPSSKTYQSLMHARKAVPNFMGLTASISQNTPADIVPLLALAAKDEQRIRTKGDFSRRYIKKTPSQKKGIFGGQTYEKRLVRQMELNARVGSSVHYVEDLDASKKPTKSVEKVEVTMSPGQVRQYELSMKGVDPVILKKIREGEEISQKHALNIFTRLMRARQVSNSMQIASPNMSLEEAALKTPKIKKILDDTVKHIKEVPDAQVIIYTNMVHGGVDVLQAGLKARGVSFGTFAGKGVAGITDATRQQAVTDYQSGKNKVIIITGAGAEGLSLGNTTMVQLADGHYNPERMAQAEARGIRAGGLSHRPQAERQVKVKRYVSALPKTFWQKVTFRSNSRSVGEYVYLTAERKARLNRQLRDVLRERSNADERKRKSIRYRVLGG